MKSKTERLENDMESNILEFECVGLNDGGKFPIENTGRGQDISPEFIIRNLNTNAVTLMITLEDLSHPIKGFTHWLIWNIPAAKTVPGAIPASKILPSLGNAKQGVAYGIHRYAGPKPPKGKTHTYRFTLYAFDCSLELKMNTKKRSFLKKAEGHILQTGSITAKFE